MSAGAACAGDFNRAVLEREGVGMVQICNDDEDTLVCWVMVSGKGGALQFSAMTNNAGDVSV